MNKKISQNMLDFAVEHELLDWNTIFHVACKERNIEIIKTIIENTHSSNKNMFDDGLCGACEGGHMDIVELMISKGAPIWNRTIHIVLDQKNINIDILKVILEKATQVNEVSIERACMKGGHVDILKLLLEKGLKLSKAREGLFHACYSGHTEIVKLLIEKKLVDFTDMKHAFYNAYKQGHTEIVTLLLEQQ